MKNEYYWLIKHIDNETPNTLSTRFDIGSAMAVTESVYQRVGVDPESDEWQKFAKMFWDTMIDFLDGDFAMLTKIMQAGNTVLDNEWKEKQSFVNGFIEPALAFYFISNGINPFEGVQT